jgi:hypothetical protein
MELNSERKVNEAKITESRLGDPAAGSKGREEEASENLPQLISSLDPTLQLRGVSHFVPESPRAV